MNNLAIKHDIQKAPKTGEWRYMKPEVIREKCVGCGTCVKYCPEATIELTTKNQQLTTSKKVADIDYEFCKGCGVCAAECPEKAILMKHV